ncbi:Ig-like domain-containing protein, partial [Exilibacterium tricleocarpae]
MTSKSLVVTVLLLLLTACGDDESNTRSVNAPLIEQSIAFAEPGPLMRLVGDTLNNAASGGDGSGAISYRSSDRAVAIVAADGLVTVTGAGSATITADKAADTRYAAASASYRIDASRVPQIITFAQAGPVALSVGNTLENAASGGAGNGVISYRSNNTAVATVNADGLITATGAGSATITADKAADVRYAATQASYRVEASLATQAIAFAQPGPLVLPVGGNLRNVAGGGAGTGAISYRSSDRAVAIVAADGRVTATGAGSATITADKAADARYAAASASYRIDVSRIPQTIAFAQPGPLALPVGGSLGNVASGGAGTGAVSYHSSDLTVATVDAAGRVTATGVGRAIITAEKATDALYTAASARYRIDVSLATQTISFAQVGPVALLVGETLSNTAGGGAGSGAISYRSSDTGVATVDAEGKVTARGAGSVMITADKAADARYAAASASYEITVSLAVQTITFEQAGSFELSVDEMLTNTASGGDGDGAISYRSSDTGVATVDAEGKVTARGAGSVMITADKAADARYA